MAVSDHRINKMLWGSTTKGAVHPLGTTPFLLLHQDRRPIAILLLVIASLQKTSPYSLGASKLQWHDACELCELSSSWALWNNAGPSVSRYLKRRSGQGSRVLGSRVVPGWGFSWSQIRRARVPPFDLRA